MKKIIAAGHVCLDITPVFPADRQFHDFSELLIPGRLIHTQAADIHTGGSVANTGLALKKLGCDVSLLGKVGNDAFGGIIRNIFADYGVSGLLTDSSGSTSYSVVLAIPGIDRVFLHNPGANDTFSATDIPEDALRDTALFHFGYPPLMKRMYENDGDELISLFRRVHESGIATSLDLAAVDAASEAGQADWVQILSGVLPFVDFFVPSFEELCWMLDRPLYDRLSSAGGDITAQLDLKNEVLPLAQRLIDMGCRVALIKCGVSGMVYCTSDRRSLTTVGHRLDLDIDAWSTRSGCQPCFRADAVRSATGAGDTSIAAFLAAVLAGKSPAECTALAAAEGACCVTEYDALSGLKSLSELEARIHAGWATM